MHICICISAPNKKRTHLSSEKYTDTKGIIPVWCSQRDGMAKPVPEEILDPSGTYTSTLADSTIPTTALKGE